MQASTAKPQLKAEEALQVTPSPPAPLLLTHRLQHASFLFWYQQLLFGLGHFHWLFVCPQISEELVPLITGASTQHTACKGAFPTFSALAPNSISSWLLQNPRHSLYLLLFVISLTRLAFWEGRDRVSHVCCFITSTSNRAWYRGRPINIYWWNNSVISFTLPKHTVLEGRPQFCNLQWHTQGCVLNKWHFNSSP